MPSLKNIRNRIKSVKSTKKITSAMKMIAATKLRRAEEHVIASRPYSDMMSQMLTELLNRETFEVPHQLLVGTGKKETYLVVVLTSDRGLCGGFNGSVVRSARKYIDKLEEEGKKVKIICMGRRGRDVMRGTPHRDKIVKTFSALGRPKFYQANTVSKSILEMFDNNEFDHCLLFYNRFYSAMTQKVTNHQLIPYTPLDQMDVKERSEKAPEYINSLYEYEPCEKTVLDQLLPNNFAVQLYRAMLENNASEHGARMTAMDSATRNAEDMINKLNLSYNRTRQSIVTNELSEIVAGAEAL